MNHSPSYILASIFLCALAYSWWIGGLEYLSHLGMVTNGFITATSIVAVFSFIGSFWNHSASTLGSLLCPGVGLIGTAVGVSLALQSTGEQSNLMEALGLAIHATIAGIGFMCLLTLQEWFLKRTI
jgi:hypothetical protein